MTATLTVRHPHAHHVRRTNFRYGDFGGRRLVTKIERCRTCRGQLLSIDQWEVRAGQHREHLR